MYASWDGEEPMLLGSTEWAEQHAAEIKKKAVIYMNSDVSVRGYLGAGGSQDLGGYVTRIAASVTDPEAHVTVGTRTRDHLLAEATGRNASKTIKREAKRIAKPGSHLPVYALGSGSDYSPFIDHLGITTLAMGYGGEAKQGGAYHSRYDTFEHHTRFEDPGMVYGKVLAETFGHKDPAALARLSSEQYRVTQKNGTEAPGTGEYLDNNEPGIYVDIVSGEPLFASSDKFESACGWPSFTNPIEPVNVNELQDTSHGMIRTEVRSTHGDSHLGHVFPDGPAQHGGLHYCINSAALRFVPRDAMEAEGYGAYRDQVEDRQ